MRLTCCEGRIQIERQDAVVNGIDAVVKPPVRAKLRLVEGGKDALGGLIPVFLDHVKLFKGKQPVRLNFRRADLEDGDTLSPRALYLPQS